MVREARFLWSNPFDDPQRSLRELNDDDLDLTPICPTRKRRRRRPWETHPQRDRPRPARSSNRPPSSPS